MLRGFVRMGALLALTSSAAWNIRPVLSSSLLPHHQQMQSFGTLGQSTFKSALSTNLYSHCSNTPVVIPEINRIRTSEISYIDASIAKTIDDTLMSTPGFSIDQLMELAGLSVAEAAHDYIVKTLTSKVSQSSKPVRIAIFCGPGNNGGDGFVAARHLKHFGYDVSIVSPKTSTRGIFANLTKQCNDLNIPILTELSSEQYNSFDMAIDGIFGFSFKGPSRQPYSGMIDMMSKSTIPVLSIDVPSGWDVDLGDIHGSSFNPAAVISLTLPKTCMKNYRGTHYIGGRFIPAKLFDSFELNFPQYGFGPNQIALLQSEDAQTDVTIDRDPIVAIYATASSQSEAENIAKSLVNDRLVACVNIIPGITSVYEWEGKVETSSEVMMMIKTRKALSDRVTAAVKSIHSYTVPEVIAVDIVNGNEDYISWVRQNTVTKK